jgi:ATP-dependent RNA helicase DeaD
MDPNVPPEAATPSDYVALASFDELPLSEETRRSIREKGYTKPTPVQAAALQPILSGRDVLVRSKTGTGKTAAFGIPLVELVDPNVAAVQAIVLCNTRELALQVATEIEELGRYKGTKVVAIYGGASMDAQLKALRDGAGVAVGTPGRVIDLLRRGTLKLDRTRIVVLDEADEMLGVGFLEDVKHILSHLPVVHQTMLFSATLTPDLEQLIQTHMKDAQTILLSGDVYTVAGIRHVRYFARDDYPKPRNLLYMLEAENPESAIIFCNTRDDVNLIGTVLNRNGFDADKLSGEMAQTDRERTMAKIKRGEVRFMVATDLAARGIDISDLTHVVNYSLPEDPSVYLHRVGRTGRIGKTGTALSLVRGTELVTLTALEKKFGITFESRELPTPEEAHRLWADAHLGELRGAMGSLLFDAFIPLAKELRARDDGDVLLAFALKYFFTHHRMEKASAMKQGEVEKQPSSTAAVVERHKERRGERARPRLEAPAPRESEPAREKEPVRERPPAKEREETEETTEPVRRNRLYVSLGTNDGVDEAALKGAFATLAGRTAAEITSVEMLPGHSYAEVVEEAVDAFLAANGRIYGGAQGEKAVTVEVARPRSSRRRRPRGGRRE